MRGTLYKWYFILGILYIKGTLYKGYLYKGYFI